VAGSEHLDRRSFVKVFMASVGGFITLVLGIPAVAYVVAPATKTQSSEGWIPAGPLENYPLDTPTIFTFTKTTQNGWERTVNSYAVYITNSGQDQVTVLSNICTHLSCRVSWDAADQEYLCPCHDGIFDKTGAVVSGPAPKPLIQYETKIEENILYFYFEEA
jgi:menaquinol-cytochrome c reductase iron-sulfur subunit